MRTSPEIPGQTDEATSGDADLQTVAEDEHPVVNLGRLAWLGTVGACLIAVLVLVLEGYFGYAGVTFAVAVAAAINLL